MQYTLNQLEQIFKAIGDGHDQIRAFYSGDYSNYRNPDKLYPLLYIKPASAELTQQEKKTEFHIFVLDRVNELEEVRNEVYSDTLSILEDVKAYLQQSRVYDIIVDNYNAQLEPVSDIMDSDMVVGWRMTLKLRTNWDANICTIPGLIAPVISNEGQYVIPTAQYLTCDTVISCTNIQNALNTKANTSGNTSFNSQLYLSGGTPLSLIINNIASQYSATTSNALSYIFSAGTNLNVSTGGTNPQLVTYNLNNDISVNSVTAPEAYLDFISGTTAYLNDVSGFSSDFNITNSLTFVSGSTDLTNVILSLAGSLSGLSSSSAQTFSAGTNLTLLTSTTNPNVTYELNSTLINLNEIYVNYLYNYGDINNQGNLFNSGKITTTEAEMIYLSATTSIYSGANFTNLETIIYNIATGSSIDYTAQLATKANLSGATFTDQITAPTANTTYLKVNTASANTTNPERVIIYDGVANSFSNVLVGIASASTYAQLNIQNLSPASGSSSDIIATANNGSESTNYVDLGINSSGFNSGNVGAANDGYVYGAANDFYVGNTTRNKKVGIFVGASSATTVDFTSGNTTFNQPVSAVTITASTYYSGTSLLQSYFPYDQSSFRLRGSSSDRWHTFTKFGFSFSSAALTNGRLYAFPLIVGENITIDRLGVSLSSTPTSAGTEVIRLGIYNSLPSTHYPGTLLLDAGTVPASAITNLVSVAINQSLTPGLYYLALQSNNTNTIRTIPTTAIDGTIGFGNNPTLGITSYMYSTNHTSFGVLPNNPFTATTNATTTAPAIFYRIN